MKKKKQQTLPRRFTRLKSNPQKLNGKTKRWLSDGLFTVTLNAYDSKALKEIGQEAQEPRIPIQAKFLGSMGIPSV